MLRHLSFHSFSWGEIQLKVSYIGLHGQQVSTQQPYCSTFRHIWCSCAAKQNHSCLTDAHVFNMSAQLQCLGMTCFWLPTANHEKTHRVSVILFSTQPSSRDSNAITLVSSIPTTILYRYLWSSWGDESQTDMSMTDIHIRIGIYVVRYAAIWKLCFRQYDTSGYLQFLSPVRFIFREHSC